MLTEDYLMRYIRLALAAIQKALGLRTAGLYQDALFTLEQALSEVAGMPAELLHRMDEDSLLTLLSGEAGLDSGRVQVIADLLKEEADIYRGMDSPVESAWRYLRALRFSLEAVLSDQTGSLPSSHDRIMEILANLSPGQISPELAYLVFEYADQSGLYSLANSQLDRLLHRVDAPPELNDVAKEFYHRLLALPDEALSQAAVERAAIEQRLNQIQSHHK